MVRFMKRFSKKVGLSPGTLVYIGEKKTERTRIRVIEYDEQHIEEKDLDTIEECFPYKDTPGTTWINIDGLHEISVIEKIGKHFNLHPLVLEDILNTDQRPKMDDHEEYVFLALKMLTYDDVEHHLNMENISLVLGSSFVITFQEIEGDIFAPVRERLRKGKGRIRKGGADYLAYALIDAIVDHYFVLLEKIGDKVEFLEEELITDPSPQTLHTIHQLKRELIFLRKSVWPLREVIGTLERGEVGMIQHKTTIFLRDVYDHTIQVIDSVETLRDMVSGMLDVYLSSVSNRMNEVMKVLTIIATTFIPLTFIAGIYGMNFKYMPELEWHWSYPLLWLLMVGLFIIMLLYFRRKKWI